MSKEHSLCQAFECSSVGCNATGQLTAWVEMRRDEELL